MTTHIAQRTCLLLLAVSLGGPRWLNGQSLKGMAGRWELQRDTVSTDSAAGAPVGAATGARSARVGAARGNAAQGAAGARLNAARSQLAQVMTVIVRGDTIITTDSTTSASEQLVVRVDTFVVNGGEVAHEATLAMAGLAQRATAARGSGRLAAGARAATQPVVGTRRVEPASVGVGFVAHDAASRTLANRTVEITTEQTWSLSSDGKTLTIETNIRAANTSIPTKRVFHLAKGVSRGG